MGFPHRQRAADHRLPLLTRGEYGESIRGGHTPDDDPDAIAVFDSTFGDQTWISVEAGLASGEWVEITEEEWRKLA